VARRAAKLLGWPVYDHDSLDYLARDEAARAELLADLPDGAKDWADAQADRLSVGRNWTAATIEMVRLILTLAARGEAVLVGRGAGFLLPAETTIHTRVVAPLEQRIAYLGDLLRLPPAEAEAEVTARDRRREAFITSVVDVDPSDVGGYDMVLNTGRLGEFAAAGLIVQAVVGRVAVTQSGSSGEFELP
jgi:cytidylate kinase